MADNQRELGGESELAGRADAPSFLFASAASHRQTSYRHLASFPITPPFPSTSTSTAASPLLAALTLPSSFPPRCCQLQAANLVASSAFLFSASSSTWPYTSPTEYHRAAVSCILSLHLPSHVELRTSLESLPSTSTSTVTNHGLQHNFRRLAYPSQGPRPVQHASWRPKGRYFTRGTGPDQRQQPELLPFRSPSFFWLVVDIQSAGSEAATRNFHHGQCSYAFTAATTASLW